MSQNENGKGIGGMVDRAVRHFGEEEPDIISAFDPTRGVLRVGHSENKEAFIESDVTGEDFFRG